jgi:ribosomal protein S27AE
MEVKICPKCGDATVMQASPVVGIIPARRNGELSPKVVNEACGFSIRAYECPKCHFVELYRELEAGQSA